MQMNRFSFLALILLGLTLQAYSQKPEPEKEPLYKGHAHNDYLHKHPLFDALHAGFNSVEADLQVTFGKLTVAHTPFGVFRGRSLRRLYLDPLHEIAMKNGGFIYRKNEPFYLMIEIKIRPNAAMPHLKKLLSRYTDLISTYRGNVKVQGAIDVIMIADTPDDFGQLDTIRYVGCEYHGDPCGKDIDASFYPLLSLHGNHNMTAEQKSALVSQIACAHREGRIIRAWGSDDIPANWDFLLKSGADLIHTDKLQEFHDFIRIEPR